MVEAAAPPSGEVATIEVIDTDTHVIEPYDLWTARIGPRWHDVIPHVDWNEQRQQDVWVIDGVAYAAAAGSAMAGWKEFPPHRPARMSDAWDATYDVVARLRAMDDFGIHTQVLYPNVGGFGGGSYLRIPEGIRDECVRAYNDWQCEWTSVAPDRFIMNCAVPFWDVSAAVAEIERCHDLGHRGILISSHPENHGQPYLADHHWDPVWAVTPERGMAVNFHIGAGGVGDFGVEWEGNGPSVNYAIDSAKIFLTNAGAIVNTIFSGICERFPGLNFVSVESGVGWIPFLLESMDWQWRQVGLDREFPQRLAPSEYFRRQFLACFWFERDVLPAAIVLVGEDNLLFETDFPHPTSQTPGPASVGVPASRYIAEVLGDLPERGPAQAVARQRRPRLPLALSGPAPRCRQG